MGYVDEVLADSPRHYWRLDESSGNFANSGSAGGSGTAGAGLTRGQASARPGFNSAVHFNGTSAAAVTQAQSATLWQSPYTLELWFKTTVLDRTVAWFKDSPYWYLSIDASGRPYFVADDYQSGVVRMESPYPANDNKWHHAAVTINHGGVSRLYIDGVQVASKTFTPGSYSGTAPIEIGDSRSQFAYTGLLDEVAIYPTALSGARIAAHFNAVETGPPVSLLSGEAGVLQLGGLTGPTLDFGEPVFPAVEVPSGYAGLLGLNVIQGPTLNFGEQVFPSIEVLSGYQGMLLLESMLGPTLAKGIPVFDSQVIRSGYPGVMSLMGMGINAPTITDPVVIQYGQWFLDVLLFTSGVEVTNPSASHEVINSRKRVKTELKAHVRV